MSAHFVSEERLDELHLYRLLVAFDGSESAWLALRAALTAAMRDNAAITVLAVAVKASSGATSFAVAAGAPPPTQDEIDGEARIRLEEALRLVPPEIPVRLILRQGNPAQEIVAEARDSEYDAILLGARGLGRIGALIGSVSSYVLHNAEIPVFVAHAVRGAEGEDDSPRRTSSG